MVAPVSVSEKTVHTGLAAIALAASIALLYFGRAFFITIALASIIAFLLDPLVLIFMKMRLPRGVASFAVCSIGLVFLYFAGVGLYTESLGVINNLPAYGERVSELVDNAATRIENFEQKVYQTVVPKRLQEPPAQPPQSRATRGRRRQAEEPQPQVPPPVQEVRLRTAPATLVSNISAYLSSFYNIVLMASFVPFLVYFLLSWRDHLRTRFMGLFEGDQRSAAEHAWAGVGEMVRAYVIGNFLLGLILSLTSAILFAALDLPYWVVIGTLSGFLSLVPYIGLPLAMVPPMIAALTAPRQATVYLIVAVGVALLHLLALNLLYPKFVGARVHLNPLVVTIALMFWGILWGGIGLLLAIPLTAAIKAVCDNVNGLEAYGDLLGD
ncbi:MAG: AI-2E family transporter [Bryobacteraceae bacterium]